MKTVYSVIDEPIKDGTSDVFQDGWTFNRDEAIATAKAEWNHLTPAEQKKLHIYVAVYDVDVEEDDPRDAKTMFYEMMDDDTWPYDWDVIEI